MQQTDQDLILGIVARDQAAFAELYDRHAPKILPLLIRWLRHRGDADDVLQDSFWHVWNHSNQYDEARGQPVGWIVQIARSRALDFMRRRGRASQPPVNGEIKEMLDVSARLEHTESQGRLSAALETLPEEQRMTILLAYFAGLTHDQISRLQDVPLGTIKTRIRLGMRRLTATLSTQLGEKDQ